MKRRSRYWLGVLVLIGTVVSGAVVFQQAMEFRDVRRSLEVEKEDLLSRLGRLRMAAPSLEAIREERQLAEEVLGRHRQMLPEALDPEGDLARMRTAAKAAGLEFVDEGCRRVLKDFFEQAERTVVVEGGDREIDAFLQVIVSPPRIVVADVLRREPGLARIQFTTYASTDHARGLPGPPRNQVDTSAVWLPPFSGLLKRFEREHVAGLREELERYRSLLHELEALRHTQEKNHRLRELILSIEGRRDELLPPGLVPRSALSNQVEQMP